MTDMDLMKRQIEAQLADYEQAIADYAAFMEDWRSRTTPEGRRIRRFRKAAQVAAE
ncbi:MAG: hypothetical protein LC750_00420 [Actinobacteria bacterium]|nr:hypothetical protein [Actinomycetota bacterium]